MYIQFPRSNTHSTDVIVTKYAIQQHQMTVISGRDEEDRQRLHIRRSNLVHDTIRAFSRTTFDISKVLKVTFIPEGSVDDGGPLWEFFQLAIKECMKTSSLFTGWPENVVPQHNVEAVANNTYYIVGKLVLSRVDSLHFAFLKLLQTSSYTMRLGPNHAWKTFKIKETT